MRSKKACDNAMWIDVDRRSTKETYVNTGLWRMWRMWILPLDIYSDLNCIKYNKKRVPPFSSPRKKDPHSPHEERPKKLSIVNKGKDTNKTMWRIMWIHVDLQGENGPSVRFP